MAEPRLCDGCGEQEEPPYFVWRPFIRDDLAILLCNVCEERSEIVDYDEESEDDGE